MPRPTPAIDAQRVYVHYGTYGTACLDTRLGQIAVDAARSELRPSRGPGSSPILFENLLIVHVDGRDVQYVIALDKTTGKTVWKTNRSVDYSQFSDNLRKAFCTPTVIDTRHAQGTDQSRAPRPSWATIRERAKNCGRSATMAGRWCRGPLFGHGLVFFVNDFERPELWAIRPGGNGDVTDSHIAWQIRQAVPAQPSLLLIGDYLYTVADLGCGLCAGCDNRKRRLERARGRQLRCLTNFWRRADLLLQPGWHDDRAGAGSGIQGPGREHTRG